MLVRTCMLEKFEVCAQRTKISASRPSLMESIREKRRRHEEGQMRQKGQRKSRKVERLEG